MPSNVLLLNDFSKYLAVAGRQMAGGQIEGSRFEQVDKPCAGAGVAERRHPEPGAVTNRKRAAWPPA